MACRLFRHLTPSKSFNCWATLEKVCHSMVIALSRYSEGMCCCSLDMRKANTALKRRRIQIPTVNESSQKMQGTTVFTELDLSQGYLQLSLAPESRFITAFPTPGNGSHQSTRLVMGAFHSVNIFTKRFMNS